MVPKSPKPTPAYRNCPFCGRQMYLSRGYYLCVDLQFCGYTVKSAEKTSNG